MMWSCERCTFENGLALEACEVCNLPRDAPDDRKGGWQCAYCIVYFNPAHLSQCEVCGRGKDGAPSASGATVKPEPEEGFVVFVVLSQS